MVLMTEWRRLRSRYARIGHIGRALEINARPQSKGEREDPHVNRDPGNYVSAAMENLHRSGFFLQRNLYCDPSFEFKNVPLVFWKLAIIAANRICKMIFGIQFKKIPKTKLNFVQDHLKFITSNLGSVISSIA